MHEDFLTPISKRYYQKAFKDLLQYDGSEFWKLGEGLQRILTDINRNEQIATLYSKKCHDFHQYGINPTSYLQLAYTQNLKNALETTLKNIVSIFQNNGITISILEESPRDNPNLNPNSKVRLACITDVDYFRINTYSIEIEGGDKDDHEHFFKILHKKLSELK